jgi:hypothetical protein
MRPRLLEDLRELSIGEIASEHLSFALGWMVHGGLYSSGSWIIIHPGFSSHPILSPSTRIVTLQKRNDRRLAFASVPGAAGGRVKSFGLLSKGRLLQLAVAHLTKPRPKPSIKILSNGIAIYEGI